MKQGITTVLLCVIVVVLLTACTNRNRPDEEDTSSITLEYALANAQHRRENIVKPDYNALAPLADEIARQGYEWSHMWDEEEGEEILQLIIQSLTPTTRAESISYEAAIADANLLNILLRTNYGAYIFYGGDDIFEPLFDNIFDALAEQEEWDTRYDFEGFVGVLHNYLSTVIADNHFLIGQRVLGAPVSESEHIRSVTSDTYVGLTAFGRSEGGFYSTESGQYVVSAHGYELDEIFRLSINDMGQFSYILTVTMPGRNELEQYTLTLHFDNGQEEIMTLYRHEPTRRSFEAPSLAWIDGFPVVRIMRKGFYPNQEEAREFLDFAPQLIDEPVVIIDVRSSIGGNGLLPGQFLHRLLGETVSTSSVILHLGNHQQAMDGLAAIPKDDPTYRPISDFMTYLPSTPLGEWCFIFNYTPRRLVHNDQLIVFLTDRHTASAGETFIELALGMQNSLVIGQSTGGVSHKIGGPSFFLPNSGIAVSFGPGVSFYPEGLFAEGVGFAPDIWATGDALDAALAMLARNRE